MVNHSIVSSTDSRSTKSSGLDDSTRSRQLSRDDDSERTEKFSADGFTEAEEAVWGDPERLARIEAILDDPSTAVPLEDLN